MNILTIASNNLFANMANPSAMAMGGRRRTGSRDARRANIVQERLEEQRREMQIRQSEDERIRELQERIRRTMNDDELNSDIRHMLVTGLTHRIQQIHELRAQRETLTAEREMMRQQALIEDTAQIREPPEKEYETEEEAEEAQERANIRGLTRVAATQDTITTLRRTRAALASEAGIIRRAISSENSNQVVFGTAPDGVIYNVQTGTGNPYDFRNQQVSRLNQGIARTDAAIKSAIATMYRENAQVQNSQLAEYRERAEQDDEQEAGMDGTRLDGTRVDGTGIGVDVEL
jgi:hypothetical protein